MAQLLNVLELALVIAVIAAPANAVAYSSFCSPPHSTAYGGYYTRSYYPVGSSVTYYCRLGYQLYGSPTSFCNYDHYRGHYWSHNPPVCRRKVVSCGLLVPPANGQVRFKGTTVGSRAQYVCKRGFSLAGNSIRVCLPNGQWSGKVPRCVPLRCDPLRNIPNGQVRLTGTTVGSKATYSCNQGFVLVGNSTRFCQRSNWKWSGKEPFCKRVECDSLPDIKNGRVVLSGTTVGSTATYSCNKGFVLVGGSTRECQANGEWSGREPFCKLIKCDSLPDIKNGRVVLSGTTVGSTATYSCNKGFVLVGKSTRKCQANGEWSGREPFCKRKVIECDSLPDIKNGRVVLSGTTVGSTATYSCNKGFVLVGGSTRECQANGEWSGREPFCKLIECDSLPNIKNGRVVLSGITVGSTATYSCNKGFVLVGGSTRVCQSSGEWSGREPFCKRKVIECDSLPNIKNGRVVLSGTTVGSTATYSCNKGFVLVGKSTRVCQSSGEWSGREPFCKRRVIECDSLPDIKNGRVVLSGTTVGSTATYSCNKGFVLVGRSTRECQGNGEWSGREPFCKLIECDSLPGIKNGRVMLSGITVGSTATYSCNKGFVLVGGSTRVCQSSGEWSGSEPFCKLVECEVLRDIPNGMVQLTGTTVGSRASYVCIKGYVLVGDATRVCQPGGEWSGREPVCRIVDCGSLSNPRFGRVDLTGTNFGSTATYSCQKGYVLSGRSTRTCQANGQWSGVAPTCEIVDCGRLYDPEFGRVVITTTTFASVATYSCQKGYVLVGQSTRVCTASGQWSGTAPVCRLIKCDSLPDIKNGRVVLSGTTVGSTATYSCNDRYFLVGKDTRSCQADGQWSGTAPSCKFVDCGLTLEPPKNGFVRIPCTTLDCTAIFWCSSGYSLIGDKTSTCLPHGYWSGETPVCQNDYH